MKDFRNISIKSNGLNGENEVQSFELEGCLQFSVENTGTEDVFIGFNDASQPLPLKANQGREFPHIDHQCMRYNDTLYVKFNAKSNVIVTSLIAQ